MSDIFIISVFAESIWDPLSTTQTSRLVNVVQKIINEYPSVHADNKNTQVNIILITRKCLPILEKCSGE